MKPKPLHRRLAAFTSIAATLSLLAPAHAETWTGATNGTWDTTTANWLTDGSNDLFEAADDALFTGTPTNNVTTATGLTIGAITLDNTFTGSVTMSGANTVSGATTISGGTLNLNNATGLGTSAVTVNSGGTVNVTLGANGNVGNVFTGSGILTVTGGFTPTFSNAAGLNNFTGTFNVNTSGGGKVALTTVGGKIGSGATVNIANGATLFIANTTASFDGVTFNVVGSGNTENLGAIRIEGGSVIGATSSMVLGGATSIGSNITTGTINAAISESVVGSSLTKVAAQTLVLGGNNTYTGATILSAGTLSVSSDSVGAYNLGGGGSNGITFNGGTLQITGTSMTSFGSHSLNLVATKNLALDIANVANNFTVSQNLDATMTTGQVVKTGAGTLTLSGANTYTSGTRANAGTTILSGSHTKAAGTTDFLSVNNVGAQNAVLKVTAGTHGFTDFNIAEVTNSRAAVYQTGGDLSFGSTGGGVGVKVGSGNTSYGYYKLSGGTLTNANVDFQIGGGSGATGVMDVTGGSVTTGSWIVLGRNGAGNGLLNVTGGSVTSNSNNIGLGWSNTAGTMTMLNVGGGAGSASVTGANNAANYLDLLSSQNTAGKTGVVNVLSNGTLTVSQVRVTQASPTALFNFNGGTLKANALNAGANFMNSGNMDAVTVYSGGGTIHNNGTSITIGNALAAATGNGVTSIAVTNGGSGYIGAPMVMITGGTGNAATGYAVMADDGTGNGTFKVSSIVITSGGTYSVDPTTVTLTGGGASTAATIGTITTATNTSGGMTFTGSGTTTLTNTNTYTGKTTVSGGSLALGATGSIANSSEITLNGGNFNVSAVAGYSIGSTQTLSGNGGSVTGDIIVNGTLAIGSSPGTMTFNDDLTIGGSAVSNFEFADIAFGLGTYDLAQSGIGSQTVTFGGTLNLFFSGGTYANNSSVQIFNFENYAGNFTTVNFSGLGVGQSAVFDSSSGFVTVVPEPQAALLGGVGMLLLLRRRRS